MDKDKDRDKERLWDVIQNKKVQKAFALQYKDTITFLRWHYPNRFKGQAVHRLSQLPLP